MPVRVVESKDNARLKELRKALAAAGRSAQGHVGIEGPHLLEEALRAGLRVTTIFVAQGADRLLDALRVPPETEILRLPAKLLHSALATETPQPIAALVEPPDWTWAHAFDQDQKKTEKRQTTAFMRSAPQEILLGTNEVDRTLNLKVTSERQ